MPFQPNLSIGQTITNDELLAIFKCGLMGGMRLSKYAGCLILISDHTKGLYEDKWCGDTLYYTGMGKSGDQSLIKSNLVLAQSPQTGTPVFLFEVLKETQYIYRGEVLLSGEPYQEQQRDKDGAMRQVWMFPLVLKDGNQRVDTQLLLGQIERQEKRARKLPEKELEILAKSLGETPASRRQTTGEQYIRNPVISEYAKCRARGKCQLCGQSAPFLDKYGKPYLECHHIVWLSQGGKDSIQNTVALCPNCHRKMHVHNLQKDCLRLKALAKESGG